MFTRWSIFVLYLGYFCELVRFASPLLAFALFGLIRDPSAHWRQIHFRPEKSLPLDATHRWRRTSRRPLGRTIVDVLISCICLGIPYLFIDRSNLYRIDEESGLRGVTPKLVIWASTCLVVSKINIDVGFYTDLPSFFAFFSRPPLY